MIMDAKSWRCPSGHCFDIASKGYVNLLTTAGKNPKNAGDNAAMVNARTDFLDKGYYAPLADRIADMISARASVFAVDSGCGEGFYTARIAEKCPDCFFAGVDISKTAIAHCMTRVHQKKLSNTAFAVGSSYKLPFPDSSADELFCIFAPVANDEYARVLKKDGRLIVVSPTADHLFELKAAVYDEPYKNRPNKYGLDSFVLEDEYSLEYKEEITSQDDIYALFSMTPYFYRTSETGMARLKALDKCDVTIGFLIQSYRNNKI